MSDPKQNVVVTIENAKHNLETALHELQKLRILDPKRIAFSAQALNNFITVTEGTVDLLSEALKAHPNPEVKSWLNGLQHTTKLMGYAVSQLFNSSINGKPNFEFTKTYLPVLIERVCNYYQKLSELRNVDIKYHSNVTNEYAWTDKVALASVMDNLLSNAVKYSEEKGKVNVTLTLDKDYFICSIQDFGPGISKKEQENLFNTELDFENIRFDESKNIGLGLLVAKELIEALEGKIWFESIEGEGTTFSISVPKYNEKTHKLY